jgi:Eukaryotic aspartyl protease
MAFVRPPLFFPTLYELHILCIVGLGPSGSNDGDISGFNSTPTFVETLVAQNQISEPTFGIYIAPLDANGSPAGSGEITFGGIDQSRIQGDRVVFFFFGSIFFSFHSFINNRTL